MEGFIIDTRDKLSSDEAVAAVSTEEEREALLADFETAEEWLYGEGRDLDAAAYGAKQVILVSTIATCTLYPCQICAPCLHPVPYNFCAYRTLNLRYFHSPHL